MTLSILILEVQYLHIINITMSDYQSSEGQSLSEQNNRTAEKQPFHYDYYLSNSLDILDEWRATVIETNFIANTEQRTFIYLQKEIAAVSRIQKFRTADVIRTKSFIHMFKRAFVELSQQFNKLFDTKAYLANKQQTINLRVKESSLLQERLNKLLTYLEIVMDQGLSQYYTTKEEEKSFEDSVFQILEKLYTYICSPKLLWDINGAEYQLTSLASTHPISLGGNQTYYKNIMRNMLKRNWQLKQVYDKILPQLRKEKIQNFQKSDFLVRMISEVMSLETAERLTEKQKRQFIDCMKGLYFLQIELRKSSLFYEYLFQSFHLQVLASHRIFKDYQELQQLYINLLKSCKNNTSLIDLVYTLQMERLRFDKRKRVPQIENQVLDIVFNYIAVVKDILDEQKVFDDIPPIPLEKGYASSKYLLENKTLNGLIGLLMAIQENSKDAFSLGDISVHKIYLKMSEIIKQIYLSYQHSNWLFPTDILLYIPLRYFMQTSDDIKTDVKKTLFMMVQAINEDRMPHKISYIDGKIVREKVRRSEYLQVILYFLQECSNQEEYINLPETIPTNLQTSILYIKSLQMKLNQKEPTPDQKPYVINMLKNCEKYKLTINFRWYNTIESIDDREIQFNIEKGMTEDWMREIYRGTINLRQSKQIRSHFDKYLKNSQDDKDNKEKGLTILQLASIFKYCHQVDLGSQIPQKSIKEEDLFLLLQEIKMLMSIHFDIFNLNRDQEASLNYIHVCLGLYNSCYKQTPYNQAYILIMQKIMKSYLGQPNSSLQTFKSKYPGFFEKWLYSFQIGSIFQELRNYIELKGQDQTCRQDIINKIRMVAQFIDNKENITISINLASLTELIVLFATSISRQAHPQVYIQSVQLFCLFLNTFTEVKKQASIDFMIDASLLSDSNVVKEMLAYIKSSTRPYKRQDISILNSLIENLVYYMGKVGFKTTNQILNAYVSKGHNQPLDQILQSLFGVDEGSCSLLINVFRLIILIKKRQQSTKQQQISQCLHKVRRIQKSLQQMGKNDISFEDNFKFLQLVFIDDVVNQLSKAEVDKDKEFNTIARQILHTLIKNYGKNDDLIYFAQKLDYLDLILTESKGISNARQQALLIDLMVENRYKGNPTELIKKIVRESNKLCQISDKVIGILTKQKDKIHSHHINKLIHVNNRYPQEKIEQFIIENIGCERNVAAVKIKQQYLINDLRKKLEKVPKNICEELLFKPIKSEQNQKLIDFVSDIFQKLLYLPIKKFQNVKIKQIEEIHEQNQDWNTQSQGENQEETKQEKHQKNNSQKESSKGQYKSNQSEDFIEDQEPINQPNGSQQNSQQMSEQSDYQERQFLDIFTNEDRRKDLDLYNEFMIKREELDVLIESKYQELSQGCVLLQNHEVEEKIMKLSSLLIQMQNSIKEEIISKMPQKLYLMLKQYGLQVQISLSAIAKKKRMQKIIKKPPKFMGQLFSDRSESDDSNIIEDDNDEDNDDIYVEEGDDDSQADNDYASDDDQYPHQQHRQIAHQKQAHKSKNKKFAEDGEYQLPGLIPSYSKIQQEISGGQLKTQELIKILQISLYWLLHLPESQIKSKHITSYYMQILSSNFGQLFFESFMTILRFDQNSHNLENFVAKLVQKKDEKIEIGLQEITIQTAINNILYFIKEYQDQNRDNEGYSNILFKESGSLLPIAEQTITKLDLPIQSNCITLLMIYIQTNRAKIRNNISDLDFTIFGTELAQNKTQYHLKYSETVRIIQKICKYGSNNKIWQMIEENMNLKVKSISKLFSCIKGYGQHLYKKLEDVGYKIMKTINSAQLQFQKHKQKDHQMMHKIQNTHHIISKLVLSCKQEIKQFYYVNKFTIKKLMEDESIDIYEQIESVQSIPNKLLKNKDKIFKNRELIKLVEAMVYFIKMLKDQFYGKIEDKLFAKLIHYPKMIIEAAWYYIFIFAKHKDYKWTTPSDIEVFLKQYPFIGTYKFNNLQQVFNLVVYFLNLQPFCTSKFKQFFLPILMKNPKLARQILLMFKVPRTGEEQDYDTQSIVVTRKCSFDMAFYQVTGQAIQVEFFGEEGSDHGGLVRELMIGWKGRGVGEQAFFIGKILGISFKQGVPYGGNLDIGMFVAITNYNVTIDFFQEADPQICKSLKYIRDNDPESLYLRFVVEHNINGKLVEFELVEGGRNIDLAQANKHKYLQEYTKKYYYLGREKQLKQLKHGFNTVVYPEYAEIFTPIQMLRQIRGQEVVDVKMLISKAKYQGYSSDSNIIKWFWSIVETFDQQKMNSFIQFVTGSPKITVYNSNFSITIQKVYDIECLPVAHTCFNTIDLPEYSTKEILQKKLLTAILQGNYSFGIL